MVVVSTQKECDKGSASPGITTAYQRNWDIVSPQFVLNAQEGKEVPMLENYLLSMDKIQAAPGTSAVHTKVTTVTETNFKRCGWCIQRSEANFTVPGKGSRKNIQIS